MLDSPELVAWSSQDEPSMYISLFFLRTTMYISLWRNKRNRTSWYEKRHIRWKLLIHVESSFFCASQHSFEVFPTTSSAMYIWAQNYSWCALIGLPRLVISVIRFFPRNELPMPANIMLCGSLKWFSFSTNSYIVLPFLSVDASCLHWTGSC